MVPASPRKRGPLFREGAARQTTFVVGLGGGYVRKSFFNVLMCF